VNRASTEASSVSESASGEADCRSDSMLGGLQWADDTGLS
jgi:hypothetical protein